MNIAAINSAVAAGSSSTSTPALSEEQRALIRAVKAVNESGTLVENNELMYSVDRAARLVVVKLINKDTGTVLGQIPNEYVLRMAEEMNRG